MPDIRRGEKVLPPIDDLFARADFLIILCVNKITKNGGGVKENRHRLKGINPGSSAPGREDWGGNLSFC